MKSDESTAPQPNGAFQMTEEQLKEIVLMCLNQETTASASETQLVEIVVGWANQEITEEEAVRQIKALLTDLKRRSDEGDATASDELTVAVRRLEFLTAGMLYGIETPPSTH